MTCSQQQQAWATDDVAQIYDKCIADLEQHLHAVAPGLAMNPLTQALRSLLEAVVLARNSRDGIAALGLLQKVRPFREGAAHVWPALGSIHLSSPSHQAVEGLLDATSGADADLLLRYRECHLLVLKALQDGRAYGPQWCNKQITRSVLGTDETLGLKCAATSRNVCALSECSGVTHSSATN